MAPLVIAAAALGSMQIVGGLHQAEMIRRQAKLKEQIDEMNAQQADVDAFEAEKEGFSEIARYTNVVDSTIADQRVGYAAQNVDVNYGTAADVQNESRNIGMFNRLDMEKKARDRALGIRREARMTRLGSQLSRVGTEAQAGAAQFSGIVSGLSTGLSGYARTAGTGSSSKATSSSAAPTGSVSTAGDFYGSGPRSSGGGWSEYPMWWKKEE